MIWKLKSSVLSLKHPLMMGILNVTPDSFYDGGRFWRRDQALEQAFRLVEEGADFLDVGAESTRPGAQAISAEEELDRLLPVLEILLTEVSIPISVDTTKAAVAKRVLELGAQIINDVSGLGADSEMAEVVREFEAGLILMHRRGTPETMQSFAQYQDVTEEVTRELGAGIYFAEDKGIDPEKIVIDPGIGFAKTAEQSLELIERLNELKRFGRPIVIGPSRKSFIGKVTNTGPEERLFGTVASSVLAFERGANIFRVHDVKAVREALMVAESILNTAKRTVSR